MNGTGPLAGRTALVTGTSPHIGGVLARGLAAAGASVACTDLVPGRAEACAEGIRRTGGEAIAYQDDVTDPERVQGVVDDLAHRWGRIDVLVNNAVWIHHRGLLDITVEDFRRQVDIILTGALLYTRTVARLMIDRGDGGSVINMLSTAALQGQPGNIGYTTAKAGLLNFTRAAAVELARHRIRVNGLTPTATRTTSPEAARIQSGRADDLAPAYDNDFEGLLPMDRLPEPDDYVGALVFLSSDDSRMMTGANLVVDGGATAKYWPVRPPRGRV
ncbi:SDR family NAD(P)-dependent oxidoreductase [Nocardioides humi]|uniref:Glucose 1-dehydrogenase n=1 Tax=Nocardioides humi TaxID=449461 RepID=A0ABN2BSM5_9ACTN|nr:SDR family oxidoreductase [Nocardioides humi]